MKFIHIGDLHLGKWVCGRSMIREQEEVLFEILDYMKRQRIDHLIIAGDIYDRLVPPIEAVELFDRFLTQAIVEYKIKVLAISGNHDSDERLNFASSILNKQGLMISSKLLEEWMTYSYKDEYGMIVFHFLPFIKPSQVKMLYPDSQVKTYQEALAYLLERHPLDPDYRHVLITHQFVAGNKENQTSESETILSVGGSEIVDVHLFDDYDYVALGHLHAPQKISRDTVRYSGSLLRYSFDEVKQKKGFLEIEMKEKKEYTIQFIPTHPSITMRKYEAYFQTLMDHSLTPVENIQDYLAFELLDSSLKPNAMDLLRGIYPNVMQLTYKMLEENLENKRTVASSTFKKMDDRSLFEEFYKNIREQSLSNEQCDIINELFEKVGDMDETN